MTPLKRSCSYISDVSFEEKQEVFSAQIQIQTFRKGGERKTRIYFLFHLTHQTVHRKRKLEAVQMRILTLWDWPQILRLYLRRCQREISMKHMEQD